MFKGFSRYDHIKNDDKRKKMEKWQKKKKDEKFSSERKMKNHSNIFHHTITLNLILLLCLTLTISLNIKALFSVQILCMIKSLNFRKMFCFSYIAYNNFFLHSKLKRHDLYEMRCIGMIKSRFLNWLGRSFLGVVHKLCRTFRGFFRKEAQIFNAPYKN